MFSYQIYNISGLDLQQVVSEHFLGHKSGEFLFYFLQEFWSGEFLDLIYMFSCNIYRIELHICIPCEKITDFKKKSVESESGWRRYH